MAVVLDSIPPPPPNAHLTLLVYPRTRSPHSLPALAHHLSLSLSTCLPPGPLASSREVGNKRETAAMAVAGRGRDPF
jgi:hypothetical protein